MLCVLLSHAFILYSLMRSHDACRSRPPEDDFLSEPITLFLEPIDEPKPAELPPATEPAPARAPSAPARRACDPAAQASPRRSRRTERVDWPIEGKKSAARVLAAEAEAERIAKMFAGPDGTWASLTKRQRSKINKFRFKPGSTVSKKTRTATSSTA